MVTGYSRVTNEYREACLQEAYNLAVLYLAPEMIKDDLAIKALGVPNVVIAKRDVIDALKCV
jgi:hypothetical protein